jgi:hypothetical protein
LLVSGESVIFRQENHKPRYRMLFFVISDHFESDKSTTTTHSTIVCKPDQALVEAQLAFDVADLIVRSLCVNCPDYHSSWLARVTTGNSHTGPYTKRALEAFFTPSIGLPMSGADDPTEHQQGFVAQFVWHAIVDEEVHTGSRLWMKPPPFRVIDHGGDGFVIHRRPNHELAFCLWEIKKSVGDFSKTLQKAYGQLDEQAEKYLAELTSIHDKAHSHELADFCSRLIEYWLDGAPQAGAGIGVITNSLLVPGKLFPSLGTRFPKVATPERLHGFVAATEDFVEFTRAVRGIVWSGL